MQNKEARILIVEDEIMEAILLKEILKGVGLEKFHHVETIEEVRQVTAEQNFDVILTDLSLPDSMGIETFLQIQKMNPQTPIIIISGTDDGRYITTAKENGVWDYFVKGNYSGAQLIRGVIMALKENKIIG